MDRLVNMSRPRSSVAPTIEDMKISRSSPTTIGSARQRVLPDRVRPHGSARFALPCRTILDAKVVQRRRRRSPPSRTSCSIASGNVPTPSWARWNPSASAKTIRRPFQRLNSAYNAPDDKNTVSLDTPARKLKSCSPRMKGDDYEQYAATRLCRPRSPATTSTSIRGGTPGPDSHVTRVSLFPRLAEHVSPNRHRPNALASTDPRSIVEAIFSFPSHLEPPGRLSARNQSASSRAVAHAPRPLHRPEPHFLQATTTSPADARLSRTNLRPLNRLFPCSSRQAR